ncbi:hypothetical protein E6C27_scaffold285G001090 [Cucumis melo var. makuwa]|uniref:Uncharacterized protein n=1 Tax=Cucumis melo var. makuwa TaxID=1194695 RepID=A0A5A7SW20_CUCMM|nr:hypothetical protein E6C27_scaffold285G001090 [Cucumis melo var. makuwa]
MGQFCPAAAHPSTTVAKRKPPYVVASQVDVSIFVHPSFIPSSTASRRSSSLRLSFLRPVEPSILLHLSRFPVKSSRTHNAEPSSASEESSKPIRAAERPSEQPSLARPKPSRSHLRASAANPTASRVAPLRSDVAQSKRSSAAVAERSRRLTRKDPTENPLRDPNRRAPSSRTRPAPACFRRGISSVGARALQPLSRDLVAWKAYCLAVRTRQVNLQVRDSTTSSMLRIMRLSCYVWRELLWLYDECRDGECSDDLSDMLYADAMCMYTAIRSSMDIDMTRVTRRGPRIPTVLGVPRGTEDQSYVPTGAHVARVRERARDWVKDEARARASWRATRSDRGGP